MGCPGITKKRAVSEKSDEAKQGSHSHIVNIENKNNDMSHTYKCYSNNVNLESKMHEWEFGTLNVRSGKEKLEGARMYMITKEVARAKLSFCCLQEVRHRKSGKKIIQLDTGDRYSFLWCGYKKKRMAGVGILIKLEPGITYDDPDFNDPRIMAVNMIIHGFKIRVVSCYSPTNVSESESAKDDFYRKLKLACNSCPKNYKLIVTGDFNAKTSIVYRKTNFDCTNFIDDELCNNNGQRLDHLPGTLN